MVGSVVLGACATATAVVCWREKRWATDVDYGD